MVETPCRGVLLVHEDGDVMFCTERARGRRCLGDLLRSRHRTVASCRSVFAVSHCRHCAEHDARSRGFQVPDAA